MDIIRPQLDNVRIEKDGKLPYTLIDAINRAYGYIASSLTEAASQIDVIQDTHANRAILHPPAGVGIGSLYFETNRKVIYICRIVSSANAWVYIGGVMSGLVAARPTDLGTNDAGFLFTSTDSLDYRWSGSAWVTLGTVRGGANLTNVNHLTKVSSAGTVTESTVIDDGTNVSISEPIHVDTGASNNSHITIKANSLGVLSLLCFAADNVDIGLDTEYVAGGWVARDPSIAIIQKNGAKINIYGSTGNTIGTPATLTLRTTIDLATGDLNQVTGIYKIGGAAGESTTLTYGASLGGVIPAGLTLNTKTVTFTGGIETGHT